MNATVKVTSAVYKGSYKKSYDIDFINPINSFYNEKFWQPSLSSSYYSKYVVTVMFYCLVYGPRGHKHKKTGFDSARNSL